MRDAIRVDASTEISIDDARSFQHFLRVVAGPARLDLSLTTASKLHDLLNGYFGPPADTVEVSTLSEDEPIAYLPVGHISEAAAEVFDGRFDRLREAELGKFTAVTAPEGYEPIDYRGRAV